MAAQEPGARPFARLKAFVRVAANSLASVEMHPGQTLVRFSPTSSRAGIVIRLTAAAVQLALPLFGHRLRGNG